MSFLDLTTSTATEVAPEPASEPQAETPPAATGETSPTGDVVNPPAETAAPAPEPEVKPEITVEEAMKLPPNEFRAWGQKGYETGKEYQDKFETVNRELETVKPLAEKINSWGGEPFVEAAVSTASVLTDHELRESDPQAWALKALDQVKQISPPAYEALDKIITQNVVNQASEQAWSSMNQSLFGRMLNDQEWAAVVQFAQSGFQSPEPSGDPTKMPAWCLDTYGDPVPEYVAQWQRQVAADKARSDENAALKKRLDDIEGTTKSAAEQARTAEIDAEKGRFRDQALASVKDQIKEHGFEVLPTDTPAVADEKRLMAAIFQGAFDQLFNADPDAKGALDRMLTRVKNGEKARAQGEVMSVDLKARTILSKLAPVFNKLKLGASEAVQQRVAVANTVRPEAPPAKNNGHSPAPVQPNPNKFFDPKDMTARLQNLVVGGR